MDLNYGPARHVGDRGHDWSRTSISSAAAYILYFYPDDINPSNNGNRWIGLPLRWLYQAKV